MERFLADLVEAQRQAGIAAFALVHDSGHAAVHTVTDPPWLRRVPVAFNISFAPIAPQYWFALDRAIEQWRPDYLHLHLPNLSAMMALLSRRARKLPWVIHWHSDVLASRHSRALRLLYPLYRPLERALLERAALVIATSKPYLDSSEPLQPFYEKCVVVPLGLDFKRLDLLPNVTLGADRAWTPERFRVLAVGRLTYYKGFDTLVAAVAQCPDVELRIVGEGDEREKLHALIGRLGLSDRVFLEGELSDAECAARFRTAQLFCLPSRERTEAFGLVLLEAMHHGLPIVASDLNGSGVTELVKSPFNGALAPVDDISAWRDAIGSLRRSPQQRVDLGANGNRRAQTQHGIAVICEELRRTTESVLLPDEPCAEAHERPLVVIPARNESRTVSGVVRSVLSAGYLDVLVVDDASTDDTGAVARAAGAHVLRAPLAQGAWGAMQTGIRYAVRHNFSSVITMDADGQHKTSEIAALLRAARTADVVIGACPSRGSFSRKIAWWFFRAITGFSLSDLTSGFRLYNAQACQVLAGDGATLLDYQDIGVLLLLRRAKLRLAEVDVEMQPRVDGISRIFHSWGAVFNYMLQTVVLCFAKRGLGR